MSQLDDLQAYVNFELPRRSVFLTEAITGYDGDPTLGGAPSIIQNAPFGTWFREETADKWWRKDESTWQDHTPGGGGGGTPGGVDTQVQYNNGGAFGGMAGVTWNDGTVTLDFAGTVQFRPQGTGGVESVCIGDGANASTAQAIAIGVDAGATGSNHPISIGANSDCGNVSVVVGGNAQGLGQECVVLGQGAGSSTFNETVVIGRNAGALVLGGTAIGRGALVWNSSTYSVALGHTAYVRNNTAQGVAIGYNSRVGTTATGNADYSVAIGSGAIVSDGAQGSVSIGYQPTAGDSGCVSIGYGSSALGESSVAMGDGATVVATAHWGIAVGLGTYIDTGSTESIAIGDNAYVASPNSTSIGFGVIIGSAATDSIAMGTVAQADSPYSLAFGYSATVQPSGTRNVAIGYLARVVRAVALPATGTITTPAGPQFRAGTDADTFRLNDGVNPQVFFYFDDDASIVETPTARRVAYVGTETADQMRDLIITAITNAPTLDITPSIGGAGLVNLVNDATGPAGNNFIFESVLDPGFSRTGMSGGAVQGTPSDNVVIGSSASSQGHSSVVIGNASSITGESSDSNVVIGDSNTVAASCINNVVIGDNIVLTFNSSWRTVQIGTGTEGYGVDNVAIGTGATIDWDVTDSVCLGTNAEIYSSESDTVVIGYNAWADGTGTNVVVGNGSGTDGGDFAVVLGGYAWIGDAFNAQVMGAGTSVDDGSNEGIAIGSGASVGSNSVRGIVLGSGDVGDSATDGIAIGSANIRNNAVSSIAIGWGADVGAGSVRCVAIGRSAEVDPGYNYAVAIGWGAYCTGGNYATALGSDSRAEAEHAIAIGDVTTASVEAAIAIGNYSQVDSIGAIGLGGSTGGTNGVSEAAGGIAIGFHTEVNGSPTYHSDYAMAIGQEAFVDQRSPRSIVIGYQATTDDGGANNDTGYSVVVGTGASSQDQNNVAIGAGAVARGTASVVIGENALDDGISYGWAVVIGSNAYVGDASYDTVAIGEGTTIGADSWQSTICGAICTIGDRSDYAVVVGNVSEIDDDSMNAVIVGAGSQILPSTPHSVIFGAESRIGQVFQGDQYPSTDAIAVGRGIDITQRSVESIVIGHDANTTHDGVKATGTITLPADASGILEDDFFTIGDGTLTINFIFDSDTSVTPGPTQYPVIYNTGMTQVQLMFAIRGAIIAARSGEGFQVTANTTTPTMTVTHDLYGVVGNVTMTENVTPPAFAVTGMASGVDINDTGGSVVVGQGSQSRAYRGVVTGAGATAAFADYSVVSGYGSSIVGTSSYSSASTIAIGHLSSIKQRAPQSIAIGNNARVNPNNSTGGVERNVVIGADATVFRGEENVVIGYGTEMFDADSNWNVVIGPLIDIGGDMDECVYIGEYQSIAGQGYWNTVVGGYGYFGTDFYDAQIFGYNNEVANNCYAPIICGPYTQIRANDSDYILSLGYNHYFGESASTPYSVPIDEAMAIGNDIDVLHSNTIVIGRNTKSISSDQFKIGSLSDHYDVRGFGNVTVGGTQPGYFRINDVLTDPIGSAYTTTATTGGSLPINTSYQYYATVNFPWGETRLSTTSRSANLGPTNNRVAVVITPVVGALSYNLYCKSSTVASTFYNEWHKQTGITASWNHDDEVTGWVSEGPFNPFSWPSSRENELITTRITGDSNASWMGAGNASWKLGLGISTPTQRLSVDGAVHLTRQDPIGIEHHTSDGGVVLQSFGTSDISGSIMFGNLQVGATFDTANNRDNVLIGTDLVCETNYNVVVGTQNQCIGSGGDNVVLGHHNDMDTCVGVMMLGEYSVSNHCQFGVNIGQGTSLDGTASYDVDHSILIGGNGTRIRQSSRDCILIGYNAEINGTNQTAVDCSENVIVGSFSDFHSGQWNTWVGVYCSSSSETEETVAVGDYTEFGTNCSYSTVVGGWNTLGNSTASAFVGGYHHSLGVNNSFMVVIGDQCTIGDNCSSAISIGSSSTASAGATQSIGIGVNVSVSATRDVAIGPNASTSNVTGYNTVVGAQAASGASATSAVALGYNTDANHSESVVLGAEAQSTAVNRCTVGTMGGGLNDMEFQVEKGILLGGGGVTAVAGAIEWDGSNFRGHNGSGWVNLDSTPAGSTVNVQDEGTPIPNTPHSTFNFVGAGVTATDGGSGVATITIPGGGGSPGGVDTQVQYNNGGAFGGMAGVTWDDSSIILATASSVEFRPQGAGTNSVKIGQGVTMGAGTTSSIAIGATANIEANNTNAVVLGDRADIYGTGFGSIAIGTIAQVGNGVSGPSNQAIAIGYNPSVSFSSASGIAIGTFAGVGSNSARSIAIGNNATVANSVTDAIAIGAGATSSAFGNVSIGDGAAATAANTVAIGQNADALGADSVVIGTSTNSGSASSHSSVLVGYGVVNGNNAPNNVIIGDGASSSDGGSSVVIGRGAAATQGIVIAIGNQATCAANRGISIGYQTSINVAHTRAIAIGTDAVSTAANRCTIGTIGGGNDHELQLGRGIILGGGTTLIAGAVEWDGTNFRGYTGAAWVNLDAAGGGGTPGGSNTQLQYNNSGSFGGIANVTFDGTNLTIATGTNLIPRGSGSNSIEIGSTANSSGQNTVCLGDDTDATQFGNIAIGHGSQATTASGAIAIGDTATAAFQDSIAFGYQAQSTRASQCVIGGLTGPTQYDLTIFGAYESGGVTNQSASLALVAGDVVIMGGAARGVNPTTTANDKTPMVVKSAAAALGGVTEVVAAGTAMINVVDGTYAIGDTLVTSTTARLAQVNNGQTDPSRILGYAWESVVISGGGAVRSRIA